jgi:hypothetical protein
VLIPCPNTQYGCKIKVLRNRVAEHLKRCNAYVITCNFCWNRSFVSIIAKRYFKRVAKELEDLDIFDLDLKDADSEILMSLKDQVA